MAAILPTDLFPNYTNDANGITIPFSDLSGLTAAEADAAGGDGREVAWAIVNSIIDGIQGLDQASRPSKVSVSKPTATGIPGGIRQSYNLQFDREYELSSTQMQDE